MRRTLARLVIASFLLALGCDDAPAPAAAPPEAIPDPAPPPPPPTTTTPPPSTPRPSEPLPPPSTIGSDVAAAARTRLEALLRRARGMPVTVRAATALADASGTTTTWALFDVDGVALCEREAAAEHDDRSDCVGDDGVTEEHGVVRAHCRAGFVARIAGSEVAAVERVMTACHEDEVRVFRLIDADGDGRPELEIDAWGTDRLVEMGVAGTRWSRGTRDWRLFEASDLSERFTGTLASRDDGTAARIEWRDADGDGHTDIVFHQVEIDLPADPAPCRIDPATGWPEGATRGTDAEPSPCPITRVEDRVFLYDTTDDSYVQQRAR